jgi:hypothetical protein
MTRLQVALTVSLVVLAALLLTNVGSRGAATTMAAPHELLPEAGQGSPARIEIADGDGNVLTLSRDGNRWSLDDFGGYPADASKVDEMMRKLADLEVRRPVVTLARYHEAMKVAPDDFERRVRFWPTPDADPVEIYMGTAPNFRITHARRGDADEVFAVTDLASYEYAALPERWTPDMWPEDFFEEATWLKLENAQGTVTCRKVGGGIWTADDGFGPVDHAKVESFLRSANGLWIRKPLGPVTPEQGFDDPVAKLTLKLGDVPEAGDGGEPAEDTRSEVVVLIGKKLEGDEALYTMTREGFGYAASVRESSVRRLLNDDRTAFASDPPEEEAEAPASEPAGPSPAAEPEPESDGPPATGDEPGDGASGGD